MRFDKFATVAKMAEAPVLPVFYHSNAETACTVLKACYEGGVRAFEFTNRGDFAHEVFNVLVKFAAKECPEMAVGVGSVVDPGTASLYMQQGACFVVGPLFNPEVARVCNRRGVPYIPGCGSATEIGYAQEAGCEVVKAFPGDVLGTKFVKGVMAPMPWTRIMVTGGVEPTAENLKAWMSAGAFCVGMGSKLFPKDRVAAGDWQYVTDTCRNAIEMTKA